MKERVSLALLGFVAVVCPAGIIAVYCLFIDGLFSKGDTSSGRGKLWGGRYRLKDRLWELNCGILGILLSEGVAFVITGALKNATGKPRPDFIDRCRPVEGSVDPPVFGLSTSAICTQTNHAMIKDGFRAFPSGHCSCEWFSLLPVL